MIRKVPPTASNTEPAEGGRLYAASAASNCQPICEVLEQVAPKSGAALELASGTGQHVIAFAARLPWLTWQPTEPDAERRISIDAYAAEANLSNLRPAMTLDAVTPGWGAAQHGQSLIVLSNLLHLISVTEVQTLMSEAAQALRPGGRFVIYGPFMRGGELTSEGDEKFHESLVREDPKIGYKDDFDVLDMAIACGLTPVEVIEMPANNLTLVLEKPAV
jgi:SAM-dependent methyltransferase